MKAIIAGAGIAGLAAALSLNRAGWEVVMVERAAGPRMGGYMVDFFGPGYDAAERLGLLPALKAKGHDIDAIRFVNADGRVRSRIDYRMARRAAGGKLFPILRGDIEKTLLEALPKAVDLRYGTSVAGIENNPASIAATLSDGSRKEADLLVGAEGIHSPIRAQIFGPEEKFVRFLGYHTAAYFFSDAAIARVLAGQFVLFTVPGRLVGLYEVGDNRLASFFVSRADSAVRPEYPRQALQARFGDLGWVVPAVLAAAPEPADIYYDVVAQVEMPRWHQGRVVLLGDAAYAVSLLAGQGASLALAGGNALGQALATGDIASGLAAFEAALRPGVLEKQRAGRRAADWFVPPTRVHMLVRDVGLDIVNWPPLAGLLGRFFSFGTKGFSLAERG